MPIYIVLAYMFLYQQSLPLRGIADAINILTPLDYLLQVWHMTEFTKHGDKFTKETIKHGLRKCSHLLPSPALSLLSHGRSWL